jgi:hypothetical protein
MIKYLWMEDLTAKGEVKSKLREVFEEMGEYEEKKVLASSNGGKSRA